jgi:hypothetical protein
MTKIVDKLVKSIRGPSFNTDYIDDLDALITELNADISCYRIPVKIENKHWFFRLYKKYVIETRQPHIYFGYVEVHSPPRPSLKTAGLIMKFGEEGVSGGSFPLKICTNTWQRFHFEDFFQNKKSFHTYQSVLDYYLDFLERYKEGIK